MHHPIASLRATAATVPIALDVGGAGLETELSCVVVEIETRDGLTGHGFTCITDETVVAAAVNTLAAPDLAGVDAMRREYVAERLYWLMTPRGQTGYAGHAAAAIDLALWDLFGKAVEQPCWRLLGGARDRVPLYTTFGFGGFDRDALVQAARHLAGRGARGLKMVVGHHALDKRNEGADLSMILKRDVDRVRAVREAVGPDPALYLDANCSLDPVSARWLAERVAECDVGFFEEPVRDNDTIALAALRARAAMPLAAGQNETQPWRFAQLTGAVDIVQPNAVICGMTGSAKVAAMAQAANVTLANGGAFPFHNAHVHAGLSNGGLVEWHLAAVAMCEMLFGGLPPADGATLPMTDAPGLGFDLDREALRDCAARPGRAGRAKG